MTLRVGVRSGGEVAEATSPTRAPIHLPRGPEAVQALIDATSIDGDRRELLKRDPLWTIDAANECEHGRLAGDRSEPCGCFPHEAHRERPLPPPLPPAEEPVHEEPDPIEEVAEETEEVPAVEVQTGVSTSNGSDLGEISSPFVEQLVAQIDEEIERLRALRAAVMEEVSDGAVQRT